MSVTVRSEERFVFLVGATQDDVALWSANLSPAHATLVVCPTLEGLARVIGELAGASEPPRTLEVGRLRLDASGHKAAVGGAPLPLTPCEFKILYQLGRRPGDVIMFDELLRTAWSNGVVLEGDRTVVHSAMKRLRSKLRAARADLLIESIRGVGFRLVVSRDDALTDRNAF